MRISMAERPAPAGQLRAASAMLRIAWATDPRQSLLAAGILTIEAIAYTLFALWLKLLLDGLQASDSRKVVFAALFLAVSIAGSSALGYFGYRVRTKLAE